MCDAFKRRNLGFEWTHYTEVPGGMNAADAAAEVVSHAAATGVVRKVTPEKLEAGKERKSGGECGERTRGSRQLRRV